MDFKHNKQLELKYRVALQRVAKAILKAINKATNPKELMLALRRISKNKSYGEVAENIAKTFITHANIVDAKSWRSAAKANGKSSNICKQLQQNLQTNVGKVIKKKIEENAKLIKTLPSNLSTEVTKYVATEAYKGVRPADMAKVLQEKMFQYTNAKVDLIARTESAKAMGDLTEARAKDVGLKWYIWRSAKDQRTRKAHRDMEGILCNYDDPPSPEALAGEKNVGKYNPGQIYNCRCFARIVVSIDSVTFPCKIYINGKIRSISKAQFKKLM